MELSIARRLMVVRRMQHFHLKHEVAIAKLTNPVICLHAGSFLRFRDACELFVAAKLKHLFREKKLRHTTDDAVILRTELANCRTFYRTLLTKRRSVEPVQPQPQPVQQQRQSIERIRRCRASARGRRNAFVKKVSEHQLRFIQRRQQSE